MRCQFDIAEVGGAASGHAMDEGVLVAGPARILAHILDTIQ